VNAPPTRHQSHYSNVCSVVKQRLGTWRGRARPARSRGRAAGRSTAGRQVHKSHELSSSSLVFVLHCVDEIARANSALAIDWFTIHIATAVHNGPARPRRRRHGGGGACRGRASTIIRVTRPAPTCHSLLAYCDPWSAASQSLVWLWSVRLSLPAAPSRDRARRRRQPCRPQPSQVSPRPCRCLCL
jgi:hypothetical protein